MLWLFNSILFLDAFPLTPQAAQLATGNRHIFGVMIESNLAEGAQVGAFSMPVSGTILRSIV
jgi:hypothetical protein